jgi:hypothetical protein
MIVAMRVAAADALRMGPTHDHRTAGGVRIRLRHQLHQLELLLPGAHHPNIGEVISASRSPRASAVRTLLPTDGAAAWSAVADTGRRGSQRRQRGDATTPATAAACAHTTLQNPA